ncbi:hypothetical protein MST22_12735 [Virgibacillus halodenitrificans]|uniref:DUF6792 domain-containing protein n=1 Tax=Virgibacillus halodenitrificans TaxID=1482 RepID=UPI00045CFFDD|nr:DUF6792 domain-containing protein [Virgibacillus halodenitrificans]MCJ0932020.1 hypothetical protein [Virgibacillus halodenitrificans]CDQ32376.1 hypothetical protein BN993_01790 [Virgibacillus halodenitrificans]
MSESILSTDEIRLRLINLEYKDLNKKDFEKEIKQIYLEEYGEILPANIEIIHSRDSKNSEVTSSDYNGTAVYFHSKEKDINELYIISQGTQDGADWEYNLKAMFAGKDFTQAKSANKFTEEVIKEIDNNGELTVTGLSHSLAHNNNTTAHLIYDTFDEIYSVNGAQTNYYQLFNADRDFRREIMNNFNLSRTNPDAIYNLDPKQLETFAKEYYKDKATNVHQLISKDDPLYAVSGARGFFTIGDVKYVDTNPDLPGLRNLMDEIPDEVIKDFQELAIDYTVASKKGGTNAAIQEIIGVNMDLVNEIDDIGSAVKVYFTKQGEIDAMVHGLNDKLPGVLSRIKTVTGNADVIFGRLVNAGYITEEQKNTLVTELTAIEVELDGIQETVSRLTSIRDMGDFYAQLGGDAAAIIKMKRHYNSIMESFEELNNEDLLAAMEAIGQSHSISEMLEGLSDKKKSYIGTDMVYTTDSGGKEIRVNISASLRMYTDGKSLLEEKKDEIGKLDLAWNTEILQCFEDEKRKVVHKISEIEGSPGSYRSLLRKHVYFSRLDKTVRGIQVHDVFYPLTNADLDTEITSLRESVEEGFTYIENYRKAIEALFDKDDHIATLFDLAGRL